MLKFGGKFDKRGLQDLRRPARHRRQGRSTSSPNGARSKSAAAATSTSRNTSAACRPARCAASAQPTRHRHQDHLQARLPDLRQHQVRLQHRSTAAAGAGLPQPRREDRLSTTSAPAKARRSNTNAASCEFIEHLNRASEAAPSRHHLHRPRTRRRRASKSPCNTRGEYTENVHSYVNNINTIDGGTHLSGFRTALTRTLNTYGKKENIFKDLIPTRRGFPRGAHGRRLGPRARARSSKRQTKVKLNNGEVEGIVNSVVGDFLTKLPGREPQDGQDRSCKRRCWRPRPARRPARPRPCSANARAPCPAAACPASSATAPAATSNAASCTWSRAIRPAAAPRAAACASIQAILPLRGKIINAYKSREDKVLANEEVRSMISAIGSRHRRGDRPLQAPLRQDRHHDRRRRRRLAHPHAAADVLLSPDVRPGQRRATSTWPSRRCSASSTRSTPTTCRPKRR